MIRKLTTTMLCALATCSIAVGSERAGWWNPGWSLRTTVTRPTPYRDDAPRPVEVSVDFPLLMERAGIAGQFDPASVRVIEPGVEEPRRQVPFACRTEFNAPEGRQQTYLAWMARPKIGQVGSYDIYFDTKERGIQAHQYDADLLPPENLLTNPGFEREAHPLPDGWTLQPSELVTLDRFEHTTGQRSLKIAVDENTPEDLAREVAISQSVDVGKFAGQEMVFECDLLAERAAYGVPVSIELQQLRADGSRILECVVQPRWLTIELAQGQLVQLCERGRFNSEAASVNLLIRMRCYARDADTLETVTGPEAVFTVWLDRVVIRPGERWPWPPLSNAGFVEGVLDRAPLNRGFEFTGKRRLAFNGASEATRTANLFNPNPKSVHWGLEAGTLELWCRPSWDGDDGLEHIFFDGEGYGHRLQSRLRKLNGDGNNELEFTIVDADVNARTIRGPARLRAGQWHHLAGTWDLPNAHLQLFVDGKRVAAEGPGGEPWPLSLVAVGEANTQGIGVHREDSRSMPMQAFVGGGKSWSTGGAAEAVLDELRISDVVRYDGDFTPLREEFAVDENTRVLFHFENERHGVHDSDDRFVRGYLGCELEPQQQEAPLEVLDKGKIERRMALVKPHASAELFEANRAQSRLVVTRPYCELPDPRFIECRERRVERTVSGTDDGFTIEVGGDLPPLMRWVSFQRAEGSPPQTTLVPRWRANDNVVPFSVESIRATLGTHAASDPEKAFEAFKFALQATNYWNAAYGETLPTRHLPRVPSTLAKGLNIYPYDQCGPLNNRLRKLFLAVGISSNNAPGTHHQFEQGFYQGSWRLFDLSPRLYWLNRDNATVLSLRGLEDDPYLKLRQDGRVNHWIPGFKSQATFGLAERPHSMDFPLRPGERASICWHNEGRWFEVMGDREPLPLAMIPPYFGNGAIVYETTTEGEATALDNLVVEQLDDESSVLRAQDATKPAALVYRAQCPYIFSDGQVSGAYAAQQAGAINVSLSFDEGERWTQVWRSPSEAGEFAANLRDHVTGRYAYWLKVELAPGSEATITGLKVRTTLVASPLVLPGKLSLGENRISFVDGPATVPVNTTCSWVERYNTDLGMSLNALSYYNMDDEAHRSLFIVSPKGELPVEVTVEGRRLRGEVSLQGLPTGWVATPARRRVELADPARSATAEFVLMPKGADEGEIYCFEVVLRHRDGERRLSAQVLVAEGPLVREAEQADEVSGQVEPLELAELSRGQGMAFEGDGRVAFDFAVPRAGKYALWLRARWQPQARSRMTLSLDDGGTRSLSATSGGGFRDWTDPQGAYTKVFSHFGEQWFFWNWYRIGDLEVGEGEHRLTLGAGAGAQFDALVLLPQNDVMDRAAMNLFQNWNYAPWHNPL